MPYWAIYEMGGTRAGELRGVVNSPPNLSALSDEGQGAAFFGEDEPDMSRLEWCPRRLSFVAKQDGGYGADIAVLARRLAAAEAELKRMTEAAAAPSVEAKATAVRERWLKRQVELLKRQVEALRERFSRRR